MKTRTLVTNESTRSEGGRSDSGDMGLSKRGGRTMSTVGSVGIARLRLPRAAYAEHAAEAAPPALRRAPSTATDVPIDVSHLHLLRLLRYPMFNRYKQILSIVFLHIVSNLDRE